MNHPWLKVLVFSLLFGGVGFLLGRQCGHGCRGQGGHCENAAAGHHASACAHGGGCSKGKKCDMAECDHAGAMAGEGKGGASCKGHGVGHGMKACCRGMMPGDSTALLKDSVHAPAAQAGQ